MYAYNCDMYCDDCAAEIVADCDAKDIEDSGDTNDYPQPCVNSTEADYPCHCAECGEFLENNLTADGREYVLEQHQRNPSEITRQWCNYYGIETRKLCPCCHCEYIEPGEEVIGLGGVAYCCTECANDGVQASA